MATREIETGFLDRVVSVAGHDRRYQVYVPAGYAPDQQWPVILFLHGAGERGTDGRRPTEVGLGEAIRRFPARYPALVVFPQAPVDSQWTGPTADLAMTVLDATMAEYSVDPARVYLTGISMGGNGAWYLAYRDPARFAALVAICGWVRTHPRFVGAQPAVPPGDGEAFEALARRLAHLPVWIFHGDRDRSVPVEESRLAAAALRAIGADVRYTELAGVGHDSWAPAYRLQGLADWLFAQHRR